MGRRHVRRFLVVAAVAVAAAIAALGGAGRGQAAHPSAAQGSFFASRVSTGAPIAPVSGGEEPDSSSWQ